MRGVAFDLPGLGPGTTGRAASTTVERPGPLLRRGGRRARPRPLPPGRARHRRTGRLRAAAAVPERVASLTILNTLIEVDDFKRPWSMEPFARAEIGEVYLGTLTKPAFRTLMRLQGIGDMSAVSARRARRVRRSAQARGPRAGVPADHARLRAHAARSARSTRRSWASDRYPVQVLWGADDPGAEGASPRRDRAPRRRARSGSRRCPAKHFLQEDQAPAVADQRRADRGAGGLTARRSVQERRPATAVATSSGWQRRAPPPRSARVRSRKWHCPLGRALHSPTTSRTSR